MNIKVLITGAHFTPAVATIEQLKKYPDVKIIYVGRNTTLEGDNSLSQESQILPSLGVKFIPIIAGRLQRSFTIYTIPALLKIPIGFIQAFFIILLQKPDVILSFGGYVALPIVFMGWLWSIPIIVHEQTLVSGLANTISSFFADKIALSFSSDNRYKNSKVIVTGNPIRQIILNKHKLVSKKKKPLILITGGNQGSHIINKTAEEAIDKLTKIASIIHVTGDNKFKDFERLKNIQNENYSVQKWIGEDYGEILQKTDLVISRAGANTLTELAYLGIPALVIPIPYLYQDEQNKNAKFFADLGLVKILPQSQLSAELLIKKILNMLFNLDHLKLKNKNARAAIKPDAAKRLALETILLTSKI